MSSWGVARRHRKRPGFHLVDYAEVGLPVYSLSLRVITLAHKAIQPIEEFVLRSVAAGMSDQDDVSAFLGLQPSLVRGALVSLAQTENIALAGLPGSRSQSLLITPKGRTVLEEAEVVVPEERSVTLHFDGLLRRVHLFGWGQLLPPKELRERGLKEIPAIPARKPLVSDLRTPDVEQVIRSLTNPGERRDLLAIRGIERSTRLFLEAIMLLYVADHGPELQVGFAIDGKLSEPHERAFAVGGGASKMGLDKLDIVVPNPREWKELALISEAIVSEERVETFQQELERAENSLQGKMVEIRLCESPSERAVLSEHLREARLLVSEKRRELDFFRVRELSCYDFVPLLEEALSTATKRLVIASPSLTARIINREFLRRIDELAATGVLVAIVLGGAHEPRTVHDRAAKQNLTDLMKKHTSVTVGYMANIEHSILAVDDVFAVISTFSWLGGSDDTRPFAPHRGVLIRVPEDIERILSHCIPFTNEKE